MTTNNMDKKLPEDFDWQFYLEQHPDLQQAGLKTKNHAVAHYLFFGKNEDRTYRPITGFIYDQYANQHNYVDTNTINQSKIALFVQWYNGDNIHNIEKCILNNIDNKNINKVHIFCENDTEKYLPAKILNTPKCVTSIINKRLSYSDWILYSSKHYDGYIKILSNSDIYFDDTISIIKRKKFSHNIMYAITRKDLDKNGNIVDSHDYYEDSSCPTNPLYSHDAWIYYEEPHLPDEDIQEYFDFDLGKGNCDRLFKKFLNKQKIKVENLYPEINAIHIDYRKKKNREYYDLNLDKRKDTIGNINDYILEQDLIAHHNNLECVTLLVTANEIDDGQYQSFLQKLKQSLRYKNNSKIAKQLHFRLIRNNPIEEKIDVSYLKKKFKSVEVLYVDIPEEYNHYNSTDPTKDTTYGKQSGPLYSFFSIFKKRLLQEFNTSLFIECDCILLPDWLYNIYQYCQYSGPFLISGSTYDGHSYMNFHHINSYHINGGICLYATSSEMLSKYMEYCLDSVPIYVKNISTNMPYDYTIYHVLTDNYNYDLKNRNIMKFLKKNFITNNLIVNYCNNIPQDIEVTTEEIIKKHNPSIIHKK